MMIVGGTNIEATQPISPMLREASAGGANQMSSDTKGSTAIGPATVLNLSSAAKAAAAAADGPIKSFADVAKDARHTIDAVYSKGSKPFSMYTTATEANAMFSGLDRRSLYAIKSNEGGQFTADEQTQAGIQMQVRMDAATGQDRMDGVTDNGAIRDMFKRTVSFLDGVSDEEKGSYDWAFLRARAQWSYEGISKGMGEAPEKIDSTSPLVKMIKAAMATLVAMNDPSKQLEDMPQFKQAQAAFMSQATGNQSIDIST